MSLQIQQREALMKYVVQDESARKSSPRLAEIRLDHLNLMDSTHPSWSDIRGRLFYLCVSFAEAGLYIKSKLGCQVLPSSSELSPACSTEPSGSGVYVMRVRCFGCPGCGHVPSSTIALPFHFPMNSTQAPLESAHSWRQTPSAGR
jgi:hypothetical protein